MVMREGFLSSYGYGVHNAMWGTAGQKMVFIHSMGMDAHSMDKLAESLQDSHHILSLTILNHGTSDTPMHAIPLDEHAAIMRSCIRQLGFHPSILIGHSIGGMMGMVLSAEHPEEFKGLVLVDIAPFDSTGRPARPEPPEYLNNEAEARAYLKERYPEFTQYYVENRLKYGFTRREGKLWLHPTGNKIRGGLVFDLWPYVEKIRAPTLLLIGENSTVVTPQARERLERTVPNLETIVVKGAGHMIPQEKPEEFEKLVRGFLRKFEH